MHYFLVVAKTFPGYFMREKTSRADVAFYFHARSIALMKIKTLHWFLSTKLFAI
jgi:hypothetical protein